MSSGFKDTGSRKIGFVIIAQLGFVIIAQLLYLNNAVLTCVCYSTFRAY